MVPVPSFAPAEGKWTCDMLAKDVQPDPDSSFHVQSRVSRLHCKGYIIARQASKVDLGNIRVFCKG